MKRLIFILFLFISIAGYSQTTWYVDDSGTPAGVGSWGDRCSSIYNMVNSVDVLPGDIVYIFDGTYNETQRISVPDGVSIIAETKTGNHINSTYNGANEPLFLLESANGWLGNYGNQEIANLNIDGGDGTSSATDFAIKVNYRSYVNIHDCTFRDFETGGVNFDGSNELTGTNPIEGGSCPGYYAYGNRFVNNTIVNCAGYVSGDGKGNLRVDSQNGMVIEYNTITQIARATGSNGYGIKAVTGWNKDCKVRYNTITLAQCAVGKYNFAIEWWYDTGTEISFNTIQGCIDIDVAWKSTGTYGISIHDNIIGFPNQVNTQETGIDLEASCSDVLIYNNKITNVTTGILISMIWPIGAHTQGNNTHDVWIYNNLITGLGITSGGWFWGGLYGIFFSGGDSNYDTADTVDDIYIWNNTMVCSTNYISGTAYTVGIGLPQGAVTSDFYIRNNIITGFNIGTTWKAAVMGWGTTSNTNLVITDNNFYNNGYTDFVWFTNGYTGGSGYSAPYSGVNANIATNPNLTTDYHLTDVTSGAYRTGYNVGLSIDLERKYWANPPSMGCYELLTGYEPPEPPPTYPEGILKYNGRFLKYNGRLIKIQ